MYLQQPLHKCSGARPVQTNLAVLPHASCATPCALRLLLCYRTIVYFEAYAQCGWQSNVQLQASC